MQKTDYRYECEVTRDGLRFVFVSDGLLRLTGYTLDEFSQPNEWQRGISPDHAPLVQQVVERFKNGQTWDGVFKIVTKTGDELALSFRKDVCRLDDGRTIVHGSVRPVTAEEHVRHPSCHAENRLQLLSSHVRLVTWSTDADLRFTWSWGSGLEDLSLTENELVGTTIYDFFETNDDSFAPIAAEIRALAGDTTTYDLEWKDRHYRCAVEPYRDEAGSIVGTVGVAIDRTDDLRTEPTPGIGDVLAEVHPMPPGTKPPGGPTVAQVGPLSIDVTKHVVTKEGVEVNLTRLEFRLLLELAREPGSVVSYDVLLENVWGFEFLGGGSLIKMAVKRLRSKLEDDPSHPSLIETVRGVGYRLRAPVTE